MQDKRRHKRYRLDLVEINGKMSLTDKVEILDISLGGVAIKADRRLNIGKEYLLKLQEKDKTIDVRGIVVRSELSGMEERDHGERVAIYTAGMLFKEGSSDLIAELLKPIERNTREEKKELPKEKRDMVDRRLHVRFDITTPREEILSYPSQFKVKSISLGGMLIRTEEALPIKSKIPMGLALHTGEDVSFIGSVASCISNQDEGGKLHFDIGVAFTDLTDKDRTSLKTFIDYLASREMKNQTGPQSD